MYSTISFPAGVFVMLNFINSEPRTEEKQRMPSRVHSSDSEAMPRRSRLRLVRSYVPISSRTPPLGYLLSRLLTVETIHPSFGSPLADSIGVSAYWLSAFAV